MYDAPNMTGLHWTGAYLHDACLAGGIKALEASGTAQQDVALGVPCGRKRNLRRAFWCFGGCL